MKNSTLNNVNIVLNTLYALVIISAIFTFFTKSETSSIATTEYYITYIDGFIKRGLAGSILYFFCTTFKIPASTFVNGFVSVLMLFNLILIFYSVFHKKLDWFVLACCFFVTNLYVYHIAMRLDLVMIPLFAFQIWILSSKKIPVNRKLMHTALLFCLGIFVHEIYFILTLFTFSFILFSKLNIRKPLQYIFTFLPGTVFFLLFIKVYKGDIAQIEAVLSSWEKLQVPAENLDYLKFLFGLKGPIYIWDNAAFIKTKLHYIGFIINYAVVCSAFFFYLNFFFDIKSLSKRVFIVLNFVLILLLCCIATDFIRWYYLIFLLILFYFIIFEKKIARPITLQYLAVKFALLFVGLPMYGWTMTHYYWSAPVKYLIDFKDYF